MASEELRKTALQAKTAANQIIDGLRKGQDLIDYFNHHDGGELFGLPAGEVVAQNGGTIVDREEALDLLTLLANAVWQFRAAPNGANTQLGVAPLTETDNRNFTSKLGL